MHLHMSIQQWKLILATNFLLSLVWFGLVWFYGISTIVGYFTSNPVITYVLNIWFVNTFCWYPQLNGQTVLFLIIQFTKVNKVKWFKVSRCITNCSIKHHSFVYIQLNGKTVLFLTIQFSIRHFFALIIIPSSCCATNTDIPDPLSSLLPIIHRFCLVLRATSRILTELLYVGSSWSSCFCSSMWGGP